MNPWTVYWLMQADSISCLFSFLAALAGIVVVISMVGTVATSTCVTTDDIERKTYDWRSWMIWKGVLKIAVWVFIPCVFISTFMPDTKTIAAMIVLPKITSPAAMHAIGKEGAELLDLTKDALKHMAGDDKKPATANDSK